MYAWHQFPVSCHRNTVITFVCSSILRLFSRRVFFIKNYFPRYIRNTSLRSPSSLCGYQACMRGAASPPAPHLKGVLGIRCPLLLSCVNIAGHPPPPASCPQMTGDGVYKIRASEILRGLQISGVMRIRAKKKTAPQLLRCRAAALQMLFRHQDLDITLVENDAGSSWAVLIRRAVPATLRRVDLANISPLCGPLDASVTDFLKSSSLSAVHILMDHTDLLPVLLEVDPAMVMKRWAIVVTVLSSDFRSEKSWLATSDLVDLDESSQPILVHLIIAVGGEVQFPAFPQLLRSAVDIRHVNHSRFLDHSGRRSSREVHRPTACSDPDPQREPWYSPRQPLPGYRDSLR